MRQSRLLVPMSGVEVRDTGAADSAYTINALNIVFNEWSLPLGYSGFYERIAPGATREALEGEPHIVSVWDHDTRYTLGTTANGTLSLAETPQGVESYTRVAKTSYASDLRVLLERGDISQCSFAFDIEQESWSYVEVDGEIQRIEVTVEKIPRIYDVTVCAMGAYPDTSSVVQNNLASSHERLENALREGRVSGLTLDAAVERGVILAPAEPPHARESGGDAVSTSGGSFDEDFLATARAKAAAARALLP